MKPENTQRARRGLAVSIHRTSEGAVRLVIDDVVAESDQWPQLWRSHVFVTRNDYDATRFLASDLTDEELVQIGAAIVARLAATSKPR
jgi:hypothetical protein